MQKQILFPELEQISKDELKKAENLFKIFGDIHNHIYANDGLSSQEAFAEVLKLLFIKVEDERGEQKKSKFYVSENEQDDISNGRDSSFRARITELFDKAKKDYDDVFDYRSRVFLTLSFSETFKGSSLDIFVNGNDCDTIKVAAKSIVIGSRKYHLVGELPYAIIRRNNDNFTILFSNF